MEVRAKTYKLNLAQLLRLGDKEADWPSGQRVVRRSRVRLALWSLAGLFSSRSSRVEIVGHGINSQLVASCQLGFLILLCCIE